MCRWLNCVIHLFSLLSCYAEELVRKYASRHDKTELKLPPGHVCPGLRSFFCMEQLDCKKVVRPSLAYATHVTSQTENQIDTILN